MFTTSRVANTEYTCWYTTYNLHTGILTNVRSVVFCLIYASWHLRLRFSWCVHCQLDYYWLSK